MLPKYTTLGPARQRIIWLLGVPTLKTVRSMRDHTGRHLGWVEG